MAVSFSHRTATAMAEILPREPRLPATATQERSVETLRAPTQFLLRRLAVRTNVSVGARFHVGPNSVLWAPRSLTVGDDVYVGKNVTIEVDGAIGDGVLMAN